MTLGHVLALPFVNVNKNPHLCEDTSLLLGVSQSDPEND